MDLSLEATPASQVSKRGRNGAPKGKAGEDVNEKKMFEQARRDKMRNGFSDLHSLLPHLPTQTHKATILEEAANYIQNLESTLERLKKQKIERNQAKLLMSPQISTGLSQETMIANYSGSWSTANSPSIMTAGPIPSHSTPYFQCWSSPNAVLSINGEDAHISICTEKKPGLFSTICSLLEKYKLEVVTANVSTDHFRSIYLIHARATSASPENSMIEEIFKLVVSEMLLYFSS